MSLLKVGVGNNPLFPESIDSAVILIVDRKRQTLTNKRQFFVKKAANKDYRYRYRYSAILVNRYGQILAIGELVTSIGSDKTVNGATDLFLMPRALDKQRRRPWFCRSLLLMFSDANYAAH